MERNIDSQLQEVKEDILKMGQYVEKALKTVIECLQAKDRESLKKVHDQEVKVNSLQMKIDTECMMILAKQGPVAKDLRMILSIIKMNTDLERMGDQCVNIAYLTKDILLREKLIEFPEISEMSLVVREMVNESLDSFVNLNTTKAEAVLKMDDQVDNFKNNIIKQNIELMKMNTDMTENYLDFIMIARNLERIGDHATNIAEDVIFATSGKDIRHGS
jgi:phosphate transport system protein